MNRVAAAIALLAATLSGCASPNPTPMPTAPPFAVVTPEAYIPGINISNDTTMPLTIVVNGTAIATQPAGSIAQPIDAELPERPWTIDVRSPSGTTINTLLVGESTPISPMNSVGLEGDLTCGSFTVWVGGPRPDHPKVSPIDLSVDCEEFKPTIEVPPPIR